MVDVSRVVLAVDSSQVRQASGDLGRLDSTTRSTSTATKLLGRAFAGLSAGLAVREVYKATEAWTSLNNRLRLVTDGADELAKAQSDVFRIAQSTRQPLSATAELYQRIAMNQKELNLTSQELADITETISKTMVISGTSAAGAQAALVQLGQAFASGTLRGEELNSVLEQAPALAQAIARGMGRTVGELRALGAEGKLTAAAVVEALQDQAEAVEKDFGGMDATIGQALTKVGNSFTALIGKTDEAGGASKELAEQLEGLADILGSEETQTAFARFASSGAELATWAVETASVMGFLADEVKAFFGVIREDDYVRISEKIENLKRAIEIDEKSIFPWVRARADENRAELQRYINLLESLDRQLAASSRESREVAKSTDKAASSTSAAAEEIRYLDAELRGIDWMGTAAEGVESFGWLKDGIDAMIESAAGIGPSVERAAEESEAATGRMREDFWSLKAAYDRGLERLDDSFAGFFKDILKDGKVSFDGLKDLFLDTLGEMIYAAARNKILISVGMGGGSSAAFAGGMPGGGSILSGASSLFGGGSGGAGLLTNLGWGSLNTISGGYQAVGNLAYDMGLTGIGDAAMNQAGQYIDGSMAQGFGHAAMNVGAGIAGSFTGSHLAGAFGGQGSMGGILTTAGGMIGSIYGPLGAFVGSGIGATLEGLLGEENNGDNPGRGQINLATGTSDVRGVGKSFDQANVDKVQAAADFAKQVAAVIGGSSAALDITVGRDGLRVGSKNFGTDVAAFIDRIFDNVVNQGSKLSESLKRLITGFEGTSEQALQFAGAIVTLDRMVSTNPVADIMAQLEQGSVRAIDIYQQQIDTIATLRRNFDGSALAAQELTAAVAQNQQAAVQLAAALRGVSDQASAMFGQTAQSIRESVMSPGELRKAREAEFQGLMQSISAIEDVTELASTSARLNELINLRFGAIENPTEQQAEFFASAAERANERIEQRSQRLIDELQQSQQRQNTELNRLLNEAATQQQQAAAEFGEHVRAFGSLIDSLRAGASEVAA